MTTSRISSTNEEALDFDADDTKPENAWEVVGKDESVEAEVKIEPIRRQNRQRKRPTRLLRNRDPPPTLPVARNRRRKR